MSRLTRYVLRQLGLGLVAVTLALALLVWLTQSLRFLDLVLNRGLSFEVFLELTLYMLPNFIAVVLPVTTFIIVLAVYHRLENDRELVVMRGAGLGPFALGRPALIIAGTVAGIGWAMNLWVVPETYRAFREYQFDIRHRMAAVLLQEGVFSSLGDGITVFVRGRESDGSFRGILLHDARDARAPATIFAERAWFAVDGGTPRVVLVNGSRQELDPRTGTVRTLSFRENTIMIATPAMREEERYREARERTVGELLFPDPADQISERDRRRFVAEAHQRLSGPLVSVSLVLVALAFLLGGEFSRFGKTRRLVAAVLVGSGLIAAGVALGNLAARHTALVPLIWLHAILPGVLALVWLVAPWQARRPAGLAAQG